MSLAPAFPLVVPWSSAPGVLDSLDELGLGSLPSAPVASVDVPVVLRLVPQQSDDG
ncbi:hypothetical protein GCM10009576_011810 [Streptomyces rhizosphaericus]|uniref:Uncharacterized protein n=2 Tax=Streptomyces rhizosphaericus TaxID=114699 RepID=A0ABN1NZU7_9ACTN